MDFLNEYTLPIIFAGLMALAILVYVILDGYDLGVGILMGRATRPEKDTMIASIGPFWDANETWLVLGVGLLLVAFPLAHGIILTALYLPVAVMLAGLILRGVSFDFRAKAGADHQIWWDRAFTFGSLLTALAQGYMLGNYIMGFDKSWSAQAFSLLAGCCLAAGYSYVGASWLIMKTEGALQQRAMVWARTCLWLTALGIALVSIATPLVSPRIFEKWFAGEWLGLPMPHLYLLPIPVIAGLMIVALEYAFYHMRRDIERLYWMPFVGAALLFLLGFIGLGYSFFPYVVPDQMTIWEAASAPESLVIILIGAVIVVPAILFYTVYAYSVFWGKVQELRYD